MKVKEITLGKRLYVAIGGARIENAIVSEISLLCMKVIYNGGEAFIRFPEDYDIDKPIKAESEHGYVEVCSNFDAIKENCLKYLRQLRENTLKEIDRKIAEVEQEKESDL